ncbi:MAG: hypothetical protein L6Q71_12765, partial [Planctomycetes bacterium]|nr:hypothetical protein [Planctomycetota bacterium]
MRYLLIVDADKRKLASTSSAPFKTVSEAIAWADDIASSIKSVDGLEEKVKLHPGDVPATKALADECFKLGRFERAVELYEPLIPMLPKESVVDTRIRFVQAVWATEVGNAIHKAQTDKDFQNFGSHLEKTRAHFNALLDDLLAAKDERTFELVADDDYPMMMMLFDDAGLDAVEKILKAFPDHKDAGKLRVQTASMAIFNED